MNQIKLNIKIGMCGIYLGHMIVLIYLRLFIPIIDQIIAFCEENNNKLIFSKADSGAFIKSYSICEEVK